MIRKLNQEWMNGEKNGQNSELTKQRLIKLTSLLPFIGYLIKINCSNARYV